MRISVIVCTFNRAYALTPCLDSIAASLAAAAPVDAEIVVVNNASTDDTAEVVRAWAATSAFPVRLLDEPKKGLSAARNCALRNARGDLLVFTDDDCRLSVGHISDALRYDDADTVLALRAGRVNLGDPTDLPMTIQTYPNRRHWYRPENEGRYVHIAGGVIPGCNLSMRRTLVDRIGYFDEGLGAGTPVPAGEDTDYVFRAYLADVLVDYVPDMAIYHFHGRKTPEDAKKLLRNYVIGAGALYAKYFLRHPNLRGKLARNASQKRIDAGGGSNLAAVDLTRNEKIKYCLLGALKYFFGTYKRAQA